MNPSAPSSSFNNIETWEGRLTQAREQRVEHGDQMHEDLCNLAQVWCDCAVGENRDSLVAKGYEFNGYAPRGAHTHRLGAVYSLGISFAKAVEDADWNRALDLLIEIQSLPSVKETQT